MPRWGWRRVRKDPLVVNLQPPPASPSRGLIDPVAPAQEPVAPDADLIAEQNSKASDLVEGREDGGAPDIARRAEEDSLASVDRPVPPGEAAPAAQEAPAQAPSREGAEEAPVDAVLEAMLPDEADVEVGEAQEPVQVAKAEPGAPGAREAELAIRETRETAGAGNKGFLSFEAHQDEMAPYLRKLRMKVEKRWKGLLQIRYSGSAATKAVLDCAIAPSGELVFVRVVDAGESPTYAGLCKEAIEKSAPFGSFPVEVPAMYRSKNLEIRWTFSFLR